MDLFEKFSKNNDPILVASTLASTTIELRRRGCKIEDLTEENFNEIFSDVNKKIISKEAIPNVLENVCKEKISVSQAIEKSGLKALDEEQLRKIIRKIFAKYPQLVKENKVSALMGEIMKETRGKIDGKTVSKVLNEELNK